MEAYRHEFKYEMSPADEAAIVSRLSVLMARDPHAGPEGTYTVRSLYFDDCENSCMNSNENGTAPREKFRLRMYNADPSFIHLELKRKEHDKTRKTGVPVPRSFCEKLLSGRGISFEDTGDSALLRKFWLQQQTRLLRPVILVEYERTPFISPDGNVRITVDRNIRGGLRWEDFFSPDTLFRPVIPSGRELLEVKYDEFLPDAIAHAAVSRGLRRTTFSKYYLCRKFCG